MDTYKLKIKIGQHEFEAEGPMEAVERQFAAFKQIILSGSLSLVPEKKKEEPPDSHDNEVKKSGNSGATIGDSQKFDKIFKVDGRIVSLTVLPKSDADTGFLVILGQKLHRANDSVTGAEILEGVKLSSGRSLDRADKLLADYIADGSLLKTGTRRGIKYRLSNQGMIKAQSMAKDLLATVA